VNVILRDKPISIEGFEKFNGWFDNGILSGFVPRGA
jgi:hypothetical protein